MRLPNQKETAQAVPQQSRNPQANQNPDPSKKELAQAVTSEPQNAGHYCTTPKALCMDKMQQRPMEDAMWQASAANTVQRLLTESRQLQFTLSKSKK